MKKHSEQLLRTLAEKSDVTAFLNYREFLESLYSQVKAQAESYSYLQFSEDLGFPKNNGLHLILRNKRRLTSAASEKIVSSLDLRFDRRIYFEAMVTANNSQDPATKDSALKKMEDIKRKSLAQGNLFESSQLLRYFSEWYNPVILEAFRLNAFQPDPEWVSQIVEPRVTPQEVAKSFELLKSIGAISQSKKSLMLNQTDVIADESIADMGLLLFVKKMTELGIDALMRLPESRRDISAVTICGSQKTLDKIKKEIEDFQDRLLALAAEDEDRDQILQINIQAFPFTKSNLVRKNVKKSATSNKKS
jgi:uncharacterized protein (TIGR02147 family)